MDSNTGKKLFASYEDAERAAKAMRASHEKPFSALKVTGGWVVGGRHLKSKTPYKSAKSLADIHALFDDLAGTISEDDVAEYATQVVEDTTPSEVNGEGEGWTLLFSENLTGRQLGMKSEKFYLVLTLTCEGQTLRIQMGGAFARHIPVVSLQAKSLLGRKIIWHTWNPPEDPAKWEASEWFYMIEPADTQAAAEA